MSNESDTECQHDGCGVPSQFVRSNGFCEAHDPESGAETMAERGRAGGAKKKYPGLDGLSEPESFEDLRRILGQVAVQVARREMPAKTGNAVSRIGKVWLTAQEKELAEGDIAELREELDNLREKIRESRARDPRPWTD